MPPSSSGISGHSHPHPHSPFGDPAFDHHVEDLRATMFYVCQGSCLCGTVNNRGKVIYCYGDLVPRQAGEPFSAGAGEFGGEGGVGGATSKDLLAAQLGVWSFGIFAILIVLILIRKSIVSLRRHLERVTDRLPVYHDDEALSTSSTTSPAHQAAKEAAEHSGVGLDDQDYYDEQGLPLPSEDVFSEDGTLTPDPDMIEESPIHIGIQRLMTSQSKGVPVEHLRKMRLQRKDFKKGGEALRGKNVTEGFRVKEKDIKRTMK